MATGGDARLRELARRTSQRSRLRDQRALNSAFFGPSISNDPDLAGNRLTPDEFRGRFEAPAPGPSGSTTTVRRAVSGGGGGDGGGGGAPMPRVADEPAGPAPEPSPAPDPEPIPSLESSAAFLALLRALGFREDEARRVAQRGIAERETDRDESLSLLAQRGEDARRGIDIDQESRGLFRSGARLRRRAEQQGEEERQATGIRSSATESIGGIQSNLAAELAQLERDRADATLQARQQFDSDAQRSAVEQEFLRRLAALGA